MEIGTREIIEFKSEMYMKEYLQLLGQNACYDEQYCYIALGQVKTVSNQAASATSIKGDRSE